MSFRDQTTSEEIANSILHGLGVIFSIIILILLIIKGVNNQSTSQIIVYSIFGISLLLLYIMSTLHHALIPKVAKRVFLVLDYSAIYVVIAATFTPFLTTVLSLSNTIYLVLLIVLWLLAILGITLSAIYNAKIKTIAPIVYIAMGWLSVIIIKPLYLKLGSLPILLLILGGLAYTLGTYFYLNDHKKYYHAIWHTAVIIGSVLHASIFLII